MVLCNPAEHEWLPSPCISVISQVRLACKVQVATGQPQPLAQQSALAIFNSLHPSFLPNPKVWSVSRRLFWCDSNVSVKMHISRMQRSYSWSWLVLGIAVRKLAELSNLLIFCAPLTDRLIIYTKVKGSTTGFSEFKHVFWRNHPVLGVCTYVFRLAWITHTPLTRFSFFKTSLWQPHKPRSA